MINDDGSTVYVPVAKIGAGAVSVIPNAPADLRKIYRKCCLSKPVKIASSGSDNVDLNTLTSVPSWATHALIRVRAWSFLDNDGTLSRSLLEINGDEWVESLTGTGAVWTRPGTNQTIDTNTEREEVFSHIDTRGLARMNGTFLNYNITLSPVLSGSSHAGLDLYLYGFECCENDDGIPVFLLTKETANCPDGGVAFCWEAPKKEVASYLMEITDLNGQSHTFTHDPAAGTITITTGGVDVKVLASGKVAVNGYDYDAGGITACLTPTFSDSSVGAKETYVIPLTNP